MRSNAKLLFFSVAVIALLGILFVFQALRGENEIALFVTGGAEGYLIPCGCRTSPAGGLSRRVTIMDRAKADNPSRRIVPVELPALFMDRGPARDVINKAFGDFLTSEGYFVSPGPRDLELGEKLKDYYKGDYHLAGEEGFKDEEIIELGGYKHLPFGKKGRIHLLFISETGQADRKLKEPLAVFREKIRKAPDDSYIVLGSLSPVTIQDMVKEKVNLLAAIATWGHTVTSLPQRADNTWVVFLGDKGRRYTLLEIGYFDGRWEVWPKTEYIDRDLAADAKVEESVQAALKSAEEINFAELEKSRVKPSGPAYTGSAACGKCHEKQYETWKISTHASATGVLEIDHQENNPACLVCHTTGFGKGGYPDRKELLAGVGCESCHGPGSAHPPGKMDAGKDSAGNCAVCHTKRDSPNFNREIYSKIIDHWSLKNKR